MDKFVIRTKKRPLLSIGSSSIPPKPQNVNDVASDDVTIDGVANARVDDDNVEPVEDDNVDGGGGFTSVDRGEKKPRMENMSSEVISDPGLRKALEEYDPSLRDDVRREYVVRGPCQPLSHEFPRKNFGKTSRCFLPKWFEDFEWLEYSVSKDTAFCFWCFLFRGETKYKNLNDAFVKIGFSNWKKAYEKFREHVGLVGSPHHEARILFANFKDQRQSLTRCVSGASATQGAQYRIRLTFSLHIVRFLLLQGLPFRGHRESVDSDNMGNFKEMHNWSSKRIVEVENVVNENAPKNAQLTSHRIQDDLKIACGAMTRKAIISDLGDKVFSLLIDEARDSSIKEQMAIVIRYLNNKGAIIERFLGVVHVGDTKARSLKKGIDVFFAEHGLCISKLRGQGYDGASNMRGEFNGLKTLILDENPSARYIHCFAHQIQLVVVAISNDIQPIQEFFGYLSQITHMVGASCKRKDEFRQAQHDKMVEMLETGEISTGRGKHQELSLARPGVTRWGSHYTTIARVLHLWSSTIKVFENIHEDGGPDSNRGMAQGLVEKMESYRFVFIAHLMKRILGITNYLSQVLQKKDQDILEAVNLVRTCRRQFQDLRNDGWNELLESVNVFCEKNNVVVLKMDENVPGRFSARRVGSVITNFHHFRVEIFCQVIDQLDREMESRFGESNSEILACMGCFHPKDFFSNFNKSQLVRLAQHYPQDFSGYDLSVLEDELATWIYDIKEDNRSSSLTNIGEVACRMVERGIHTVFPLVYRLLELVLVLPVATATVERAFSAMKIVKSQLRNRMSDENLTDSLVCYIEKESFKSVDDEDILQYYQNMSNRKMGLPPLAST